MKIAFITTYYRKEDLKDVERVKKEIQDLGFKNYEFYVSNCIDDNRGYSAGINKGIKRALHNKADIFVVLNADISFKNLTKEQLLEPSKQFDIWGFAHKQQGKVFYGGTIDKWRMSGGLIGNNQINTNKQISKYINVDFVSGSLILFTRRVVEKIGLWDESYFLYYDEVDFCERARRAGFKIGIDTRHSYEHFERSDQNNPRKKYYLAKSRAMFLWRFGNYKQKLYELIRLPKTIIEERKVILSYFKASNFLTNFINLNISAFINKVINFVLFLFLIRYLKIEDYGIYTLIWAQTTVLSALVDLGTTSYGLVYLSKNAKEKFNSLLNLRFFLSVIIFILTIVISVFTLKFDIRLVWLTALASLVIFSNMFSGSYLIWTAVQQKVYKSSIVSVVFNIFFITSLIILTVLKGNLEILFIGIGVGYLVYSVVCYILLKRELGQISFRISFNKWKEIIKYSYVFVLISFFANLYFKLDVFLLNFIIGPVQVAIYSAGYKFLEALMLISASYNIIIAPVLARLALTDTEQLRSKIVKHSFFLILLGCFCSSVLVISAPILLPFFLKSQYSLSIPVTQVVVLAFPFILLNSLFMNVLYVLKKAYLVVWVFGFQVVVNLTLNVIFIPYFSYSASSWITVISEIINVIIAYYLMRKVLFKKI